jgi:hypothetical protein
MVEHLLRLRGESVELQEISAMGIEDEFRRAPRIRLALNYTRAHD